MFVQGRPSHAFPINSPTTQHALPLQMPFHSTCPPYFMPSLLHALPSLCPTSFLLSLLYALPSLCLLTTLPSHSSCLPLLLLLLAVLSALPTKWWRRRRSRSRMKGGGREGQACLQTSQCVAVLSVPAEEKGPGGGPGRKEDMIFDFPLALFPLAFPPAVPALGFFLPRRS